MEGWKDGRKERSGADTADKRNPRYRQHFGKSFQSWHASCVSVEEVVDLHCRTCSNTIISYNQSVT